MTSFPQHQLLLLLSNDFPALSAEDGVKENAPLSSADVVPKEVLPLKTSTVLKLLHFL